MKVGLLLILFATFFISCSSNIWNVSSVKYTDVAYPPKSKDFNVEIIHGITKKPHITIAHISIN